MFFLSITPSSGITDIYTALTTDMNKELVTNKETIVINMSMGAHYILGNNVVGKKVLLNNLIAIRKLDDLIIVHEDGSKVVFVDYFLFCDPVSNADSNSEQANDQFCSVTVADESNNGHTITSQGVTNDVRQISDTSSIVYMHGDQDLLEGLIDPTTDIENSLSPSVNPESGSGFGWVPGGTGTLDNLSSIGDLLLPSLVKLATLAVSKVYNLSVFLGPEINGGMGTEINLYKADGTKIGVMEYDSISHTYTYTDTTGYSGIVIAHLKDTDASADYIDEATGLETNMTAELYVVATVDNTESAITLSISPLSTIAAKALGITDNGDAVFIDKPVDYVNSTNKMVAEAFGLGSDIDLARAQVKTTIDSDGNSTSDANAYGQVLAIISAAEQLSPSHTTATVIDDITNNLNLNGTSLVLSASVKSMLVESAFRSGIGAGEASRLLGGENSENQAPSGSVAISGIVEKNQTLTALTSTLNDADGNGAFSYQWQANSIDISGATQKSNTLTQSEVGKTITVEVSYTDGKNVGELVESSATKAVAVNLDLSNIPHTELSENQAYTFDVPSVSGGPVGAVTYTIEGEDAAHFTVDSVTGVVKMAAKDFENPADIDADNTYAITLRVTDDDGNSATDDIRVSVSNLNDNMPVITSAATAKKIDENGSNFAMVYTAEALDADTGDTLSFSLTGSDARFFEINSNTGDVKIKAAANTDIKDDYNFNVEVTDGTHTGSQAVSLAVNTLAPTLSRYVPPALALANGGDSIGDDIALTITFDGNVEGLTSGTNSTIFEIAGVGTAAYWSGTSGSSTRVLTYTVSSGQKGQVTLNEVALTAELAENVTDAKGNGFVYSFNTGPFVHVDGTPPTVSILLDESVLNIGESATITLTFSEIPKNLSEGNITATNGVISSLTMDSLNDKIFRAVLTASAITSDAANVVTVNTDWSDVAGNNPVSSIDSNEYTVVDTVAAIMTLSVSNDDVVNSADLTTQVQFGGTTKNIPNGQTVTVEIGGVVAMATIFDNVFDGAIDLSALPDNESLVVAANVSNLEGDAVTEFSIEMVLDTSQPNIFIDALPAISSGKAADLSGFSVKGSAIGAEGQTLTIEVSAKAEGGYIAPFVTFNKEAVVGSDGNWGDDFDVRPTYRFVRVAQANSTANQWSHLVEISILDDQGENLVLNAEQYITSFEQDADGTLNQVDNVSNIEKIVNGVTGSDDYIALSGNFNTTNIIQFDLGQEVRNLSSVDVWRYYPGRTYNHASVSVSVDGQHWRVLHDEPYSETSSGKHVAVLYPTAYELTVKATVSDTNGNEVISTANVTVASALLTLSAIKDSTVIGSIAYDSGDPILNGSPIGDVIYTLEGVDADDFAVNSTTGVVSMTARSVESPADKDLNNTYYYTLIATDADGNFAMDSVLVTVKGATFEASGFFFEAPVPDNQVIENTIYRAPIPILTDATQSVIYTLQGSDASHFTVDSATGAVRMAAKNFESPVDSDANNTYVYTLKATNADGNAVTDSVFVTVIDANVETANLFFSASANGSVAENTVYSAVAPILSGGAIGAVIYSLGGEDAAHFIVDSATGRVGMVAKDFDNPEDVDANNVYTYTLNARDSDDNVAINDVAVTVTDTALSMEQVQSYRYVMVRKKVVSGHYQETSALLAISELEVFSEGVNVAAGRPTQFSWANGTSSVLTDSNSSSFTETSNVGEVWVQVDLGSWYTISSVKAVGRSGWGRRLLESKIYLSDSDMTGYTTAQLDANAGIPVAQVNGLSENAFTTNPNHSLALNVPEFDSILSNRKITVNSDGVNTQWAFSLDSGITWDTGSSDFFILDGGTYAIGQIQIRQTFPGGYSGDITSNAAQIVIYETTLLSSSITHQGTLNDQLASGDIMTLELMFSDVVTIDPSVLLNFYIGDTQLQATYVSGAGSDSLFFNYQLISAPIVGTKIFIADQDEQWANILSSDIKDKLDYNIVPTKPNAITDYTSHDVTFNKSDYNDEITFSGTVGANTYVQLDWADQKSAVVLSDSEGLWSVSYFNNNNFFGIQAPSDAQNAAGVLKVNQTQADGSFISTLVSKTVQLDTVMPTILSIESNTDAADLGAGDKVTLTVTFSEDPGVDLTATAVSAFGFNNIVVSGSGTSRDIAMDVDASEATLGSFTLKAHTIFDSLGNANDESYHWTIPIVIDSVSPLTPLIQEFSIRAGSKIQYDIRSIDTNLDADWRVVVTGLEDDWSLSAGSKSEISGDWTVSGSDLSKLQLNTAKRAGGSYSVNITYQFLEGATWHTRSKATTFIEIDPWIEAARYWEDYKNYSQIEEAWNIGLDGQGIRINIHEGSKLDPEAGSFSKNNVDATTASTGVSASSHAHGVAQRAAGGLESGFTGSAYNATIMSQSTLSKDKVHVENWSVSNGGAHITSIWAFSNQVITGRGGLGAIVTISAGNHYGSNVAQLTSTKSAGAIPVGALFNSGGTVTGFSNQGEGLHIAAAGGGGTSHAAPLVAGITALMVQKNPDLGYRDVQQIIAYTATYTVSGTVNDQAFSLNEANTLNGQGLHFSSTYGFGVINAYNATRLSDDWLKSGYSALVYGNQSSANEQDWWWHNSNLDSTSHTVSASANVLTEIVLTSDDNVTLESVTIKLHLSSAHMKQLHFWLVSPSGTISEISQAAVVNSYNQNLQMNSRRFWGESSEGEWKLIFQHTEDVTNAATAKNVELLFYGQIDQVDDRYIYTEEISSQWDDADEDGRHQMQSLNDRDGGNDSIMASAMNSNITIKLGRYGHLEMAEVNAYIIAGASFENAFAGYGDDLLVGSQMGGNWLSGSAGQDTIISYGNHSTLEGGDGRDIVWFNEGDTVSGGKGSDYFVLNDSNKDHTVAQAQSMVSDFDSLHDYVIRWLGNDDIEIGLTASNASEAVWVAVKDQSLINEIQAIQNTFYSPAVTSLVQTDTGITLTFSQLLGVQEQTTSDYSLDSSSGVVDISEVLQTSTQLTISHGLAEGVLTLNLDANGLMSIQQKELDHSLWILGTDEEDTLNYEASTNGLALFGGGGSDTITGGSGDDLLIVAGVEGGNTLAGGEGADTFQWLPAASQADNAFTSGTDIVKGFNVGQKDVLDLSYLLEILQPTKSLQDYIQLSFLDDDASLQISRTGEGTFVTDSYSILLEDSIHASGLNTSMNIQSLVDEGIVLV